MDLAPSGALYVSVAGNDSAAGTLTHPFGTIERAQVEAATEGVRTIYVGDGTYMLRHTLRFGPPSSHLGIYASAGSRPVLDGHGIVPTLMSIDGADGITVKGLTFAKSSVGGTGLLLLHANNNRILANWFDTNDTAIVLTSAGGNLLSGNRIDRSGRSGIEAKDGSNDNTITDNVMSDVSGPGTTGGGIFLHGANDNIIAGNVIDHTAGMGIGIENWDRATINQGNTVCANVVRDTNSASADSGAIYVLGRSRAATRLLIANNRVEQTGRPDVHAVGIYLDDSANGVTVVGNILRITGSDAVQIHGGSNNHISNNIIDLGGGSPSAVLFQAAPADTRPDNAQAGNVVSRNIIYSSSLRPRPFAWIDGGAPMIAHNLYFDTSGASMITTGPIRDVAPVVGDPRFIDATRGNYGLRPGSAAALIGFAAIDPPVISQNSTKACCCQRTPDVTRQ